MLFQIQLIVVAFLLNSQPSFGTSLKTFFNQNPRAQYTEPYRGISRPGDDFEEVFNDEAPINEKKAFIRRYIGQIKVIPKEKRALVGWYPIPKPSVPILNIAGAGFEPTTFRL